MASQVTVPGPNGTPVTFAAPGAASTSGGFAAAQIAYAISTLPGASFNQSSPSGSNVTLAAPTMTGGNTTAIAYVGGGGNSAISVPSGSNGYSVVELQNTTPDTVSGANLTILANAVGDTFDITGTSTIVAGGNVSIVGAGTYTIAVNGNGTTSLVVVGSGNITGGTGTNTIIATDPGGNVITSSGTNDVIVANGLASVIESGPTGVIWSGTVPSAANNFQQITVSGTGDSVVAGAVADTITASGIGTVSGGGDFVYGDFATTPTPMLVSIGGSSAGAGSYAEVAIYNSNATVNVGTTASDVVLFGNYGTLQSSLVANLDGAGGIVLAGDSNVTVTTGSQAPTAIYGGFTSDAGMLNVTDNNTVSGAGPGGAGTVVDIGNSAATVNTNGQDAWVFGSFGTPGGGLTVNDGGSFDTVDAGQSNLVFNSTGGRGLIFGSFSTATTVNATLAGNANVVDAANSAVTVTEVQGASNNTIYGGFGVSAAPLSVSDAGNRDLIDAGNSAANVSLSGTSATVYGSFGATTALSVDVSGGDTNGFTDNYVVTGNSSASVTASSGTAYLDVVGGSGNLSFLASASGTTSTVWGGSGNTNISVGAGAVQVAAGGVLTTTVTSGFGVAASVASVVTLFGSSGSDVTFLGSAGGALYYAGAGNETLNAAGASANTTLWGGSSADSLTGGSGNNTIIAGGGNDTLTGGTGSNTFLFLHGGTVHDVINNFTSGSSTLELFGYGIGSAAYTATVSGGATVLTLSDNTTITFSGVTNTSLITTHILTG